MRKIGLPNINDPDMRFKISLLVGAVAIFGLFFFAVAMPLASNPTFCGMACHNMNPEWQTWKKSSHAAVSCYACHGDRSYITFFREKLLADPIGAIASIRDTYEKPINKDDSYSQDKLPANRCLRCHSPENRKFTPRKGLNVTSKMHMKHLDAGLQCTTCHNRITHLGAENYEPLKSEWPESKGFKYKNFITMRQGCWRCHSNDPKYRNEETLKIITNGKTPPTSCSTCHNQDWNLKPSVGEYNHNVVNGVAWRVGTKRHGIVALQDFSACFGCHPQTGTSANGLPNCSTTCHQGITMPHNIPKNAAIYAGRTDVPQWRHIHFKVAAQQGTAMCQKCHNPDGTSVNFCQTCHHQQFSSVKPEEKTVNWKEIHFQVVKQIGASQCFKCHQPNFCASCHTTGTKPAPGLFFNMKY